MCVCVYLWWWSSYRDSVDNIVEENSSILSLIRMRWLPSARACSSKTLHQENPPVFNWRCRLTQVDLYIRHKTAVVFVIVLVLLLLSRLCFQCFEFEPVRFVIQNNRWSWWIKITADLLHWLAPLLLSCFSSLYFSWLLDHLISVVQQTYRYCLAVDTNISYTYTNFRIIIYQSHLHIVDSLHMVQLMPLPFQNPIISCLV